MPPKKNKGGKKKGGTKANNNNKAAPPVVVDDDDDWEALLEVQHVVAPAEPVPEDAPPAEEDGAAPPDAAQDAAAAFLAAQGMDAGDAGGGGGTKSKKKKKKKKGAAAGGGGGTEKKADEKVSARGRMVAERLAQQKREEEEHAALQAAETARVAAIVAAEQAAEERIAAEKERKKQKQREKVERQKREGTYMTKAQKQKAALAAQRLEAMKAAGMLPSAAVNKATTNNNNNRGKGKGGFKGKQQQLGNTSKGPMIVKEETLPKVVQEEIVAKEEPPQAPTPPPPAAEEESSGDEWDADSDDEGDEVKFAALAAKLEQVNVAMAINEDEDLIAAEKRKEVEKLRMLGLERERRDREEAIRVAALSAEREALQKSEQLKELRREEGRRKRLDQEKTNLANRSRDDLRCPVVVIMGHVDTGKTKLLDKIRKTNVQEGEAGGITQQIGATFFEKTTLETQTKQLLETENFEITVPGMLVIDTPGHESFTNLRSRGSSLCDVAILVIDLMHGLEQQTIESLNMLRKRNTPFVVALNKVDRCYNWQTCKDTPIRDALKQQPEGTLQEFRSRATETKVQLQEQGVNSNIYWEMGEDDWESSDFIPLVPTSAISGEGVQDVLLILCQMAQRKLWRNLMWCANLQATVLEVKAIDGLGMTVDVLVVNGYLREGDKAVFCTLDGPVVTEIRGLLTPPPSREMRVKSEYIHHKEVKGALGVKVIGNNLDKVMAGTPVMIVGENDEEEDIKAEVMSDLVDLQSKLSTDKKGVMVQASTLGALEALLQFLREETKPPIPVSAVGIGSIHKRDVTRISVMNEKGVPEYATILAFDVHVEKEAREHATESGVRIFTADIIYHLFDQFTRFMEDLHEKRRQDAAAIAVFPSIIKILPQHVFNQKDPIIVGVEVVEGILKVGTPLCIPSIGCLHIGKVTSIEANGKEQETARKGASVAVKIVNEHNPTITYGRQFDCTNSLYSTLTRASIDALKTNFKDKLENEDWRLVVKLKKVFGII